MVQLALKTNRKFSILAPIPPLIFVIAWSLGYGLCHTNIYIIFARCIK